MAKPSGQEARNIYARAVASANAGDRTTAIKLFEQLIGSDAPQVQVRSALVRLNLDAHAWTQAADHMIALVPLIPSPAQLLADAADTYSRAGAFDKAHETYEHLHRAMPDYATGYFNHAYMLRTAHRFDEALAYYDKALAHGIDGPEEVWLNKAVIYSDHLRDDGAAAACLATALDIKADYVPALLNRANLYEEMSDRDGARESYRRVVELDPHNTTAVARLINLDAGEVTSPIRTTAQKMANHSGIQARARSSLNFALGRDADARGDYDTAFEYFRMANETAKPLGPAYDRAASETFTQDLITQFSKDWFNKLPVYSDATPVFICGMFRSGSTLTEQVIAAHPDATPGGELEYFIALATRELAPFPAAVRGTKPDKMREMARHYLQLLAKRFPGGGLITDKRPDNFLYIALSRRCFPMHVLCTPRGMRSITACRFIFSNSRIRFLMQRT